MYFIYFQSWITSTFSILNIIKKYFVHNVINKISIQAAVKVYTVLCKRSKILFLVRIKTNTVGQHLN